MTRIEARGNRATMPRMKQLAVGWMLLLALLGACADDGGGNTPAPRTFGAACTTVADTGSTECDSGVCTDTFDQIGHPVCSAKCTAGDASTCPEGSEGKKCNMRGFCKP
jgi:hypothetical protein